MVGRVVLALYGPFLVLASLAPVTRTVRVRPRHPLWPYPPAPAMLALLLHGFPRHDPTSRYHVHDRSDARSLHWGAVIDRLRNSVELLDAGGLALFAVAGAQKALDFHLGPIAAMLLGMLTGIGGGIVRDMLSNEVPAVLRGDVYAVAALAGAAVVVAGRVLHLPSAASASIGAALCFGIRVRAIQRRWQLPVARWSA